MIRTTLIVSALLILTSAGFFIGIGVGQGQWQITALIPAFAGVLLAVLAGIASLGRLANIIAMHVAMLLALLGILGSAMGVPKLITMLSTGESERGLAPVLQSIMAVVLLVYLILGIRSFIAARRAAKSDVASDRSAE
ncbi:MAG: hypothetical protein GVY24_00910 [Planctomycetes bacterium]|jgi:fucose 4-O-acetylase-like acetyltransferase|nr:hypothetical protein [Planctomycetota bacterium]